MATDDPYGTVYLGGGKISKEPPVVLGPITDSLKKFEPLGWYAAIKNPDRKRWQFWKPKMKTVWGEFKRGPNVPGNIPDNLAGEPHD